VADWEILAEGAPQIAGSKEDIARTVSSRETWFLAVMVVVAGYGDDVWRKAEARLALESVYPASARTDPTRPEHLARHFRPAMQFTGLQKIRI
jgi:hypothetical protein